jgi:hypothetical protein
MVCELIKELQYVNLKRTFINKILQVHIQFHSLEKNFFLRFYSNFVVT